MPSTTVNFRRRVHSKLSSLFSQSLHDHLPSSSTYHKKLVSNLHIQSNILLIIFHYLFLRNRSYIESYIGSISDKLYISKSCSNLLRSPYLWLSFISLMHTDEVVSLSFCPQLLSKIIALFKWLFWWYGYGHILVRTMPGIFNYIENHTKVYNTLLRGDLLFK